MIHNIIKYLLLVLFTIGVTYFTPAIFSNLVYAVIMIVYFRSGNEPFWLAYFLTISDGFASFLGSYEAVLTVIPGLPAVELGQIYIILTLVKAYRVNGFEPPYYAGFLKVLAVYLVFLILQGYTIGLDPALNVQFRTVKWILPFFLFYSIPRLLRREKDYEELFQYLFIVSFAALFTQVFSIIMSQTPKVFAGIGEQRHVITKLEMGFAYRGIFNSNTMLITLFGALSMLALQSKAVKNWYLFAVIAANFLSVFLSATRGWILSFGFILFLFSLFVMKLSPKQLTGIVLVLFLSFAALYTIPIIQLQFSLAIERFMTLEALADNDKLEGGNWKRLTERAPRVMRKWRGSKLTGFGFSDDFLEYRDQHVGNQNILLHSGIIGSALMGAFFLIYLLIKPFLLRISLPRDSRYRDFLLTVVIFFTGWFMIHSSSGQLFSYHQEPSVGMVQAIFLSLTGLIYKKASRGLRKSNYRQQNEQQTQQLKVGPAGLLND